MKRNFQTIIHTRSFRLFVILALLILIFSPTAAMAMDGSTSDPLTVINNLSDLVFSIIRAVGVILLGWGVVQVGLSFKSQDPNQRSNGFLSFAGGVIITFSKEILHLIGVI